MRKFIVKCGKIKSIVKAETQYEAFKKFITGLKSDDLKKLAILMVAKDYKREYVITTPTLLYLAGLIDADTCIVNIANACNCGIVDAVEIFAVKLKQYSSWWGE